jgi:hypothetical protein
LSCLVWKILPYRPTTTCKVDAPIPLQLYKVSKLHLYFVAVFSIVKLKTFSSGSNSGFLLKLSEIHKLGLCCWTTRDSPQWLWFAGVVLAISNDREWRCAEWHRLGLRITCSTVLYFKHITMKAIHEHLDVPTIEQIINVKML